MATTTSSANTLGTAQVNSPVTSAVKSQEAPPSLPWWRYGMVWMVIAGPAIVVVAGFITLWIAISRPDPVVDDDYYQRGLNITLKLIRFPACGPQGTTATGRGRANRR